jgi:hypothetical protein
MSAAQREAEQYVSTVIFPTTKEEIINGLLASEAPGRVVALVERLPADHYNSSQRLLSDIDEVSRVHIQEVAQARTYEDFLAIVLRHVGDIRHSSKDAFNRVVAHVIHMAEEQLVLDEGTAQRTQQQLEAAFAGLRGTMSEVFDDNAPVDPKEDLPRVSS